MIISKLIHSNRIESLHPLFKELFDYVKEHDLLKEKPGRIVLKGDDLFINHVVTDGADPNKQPLEIHRDYIDIHIPLEGREIIGWKPTEELLEEIKPYEKEGDCALYSDKSSNFVEVATGEFVIVFPEDAHAPAIGKNTIHKLIAKVKIANL